MAPHPNKSQAIRSGIIKLSAYLPVLRPSRSDVEQPPPAIQRQIRSIDRTINPAGIHAALGDRWTIVGITGSGKTTFCKALLDRMHRTYTGARIYIIDSKWMGGDFENYPGIVRSATPPDPLRTPGGIQVWQTPHDDPAAYDHYLRAILKAGKPAFIYIDELSSLSKGSSGQSNSYPIGLSMLLKQGRGVGIGAAICTQNVARIPADVLNQTTHIVRFPLELSAEDYDARKIDKRLKRPRSEHGLDPAWYSFLYRRNQGQTETLLFSDYRDFFSGGR